jgi:putative nucleotidyltransferase with HDIG domain
VPAESAGSGASKLFDRLSRPITDLAQQVMVENRTALAGPGGRAAIDGVSAAAIVPLAGDPAPAGAIAVVHTERGASFDAAQLDALSTLAGLASVALHNAELRDAQRNFFAHVTEILVGALDAHLGYNAGHGARVAQYANHLGHALGLDEQHMQRLHFAALLHDIGMLRLERSLLDNAKACAKHTVLGGRMLARIRLWKDLAPLVQAHHEWFDGSGQPEGLAGEGIPLLARMIAVCDCFDAMTASASYKATKSFAEAADELERCSGTQFDPQIVQVFVRLVNEGTIAP